MLDALKLASATALVFTLGAFAIARTGRHADQATVLLASVAIGLGMLALVGGLTRLDADGSAISQADARPDYGMSWRPSARGPAH
ncbi:hypothetical protein MMSR116_18785 [Methylobacterium mesophilicum SR1.6/6]|uniref:Uncharacterized protein n=1 Tax=Methylobacterium mesophilicum SR1.6/6 TaxID=908290 RepID=A0A6B9FME6_9HYPH|nr:hypothetical protein [Methylobacterium mesophilicum]QGY03713.1 hypothetical protein MMSR116_18785 [Methylobacterium mesophilicum SR1.6/6]